MAARTSAFRALAALLLSTIALLGLAASAHADLYWANTNDNTIGRSTVAGGSADQDFVSTFPILGGGLAMDADHLYWANYNGYIGRSDLDGGNVEDVFIFVSGHNIAGVAVDSQHVYWTYSDTGLIGRANLDGTGVDDDWISIGAQAADSITLTASAIYFTIPNSGTIGRANLNGSGVNPSYITGLVSPRGLANDGTYLYWGDFGGQAIGRITFAGTDKNTSFVNLAPNRPSGVAVAGGRLLWSEPLTGRLGSADAGTGGDASYIVTGANSPTGVVAMAPSFAVSPTTKDFGEAVVDTDGPQQTFTVTNDATGPGAAPLVFEEDAVTLTGTDADQFTVDADTCSGESIAVGATCAVTVAFDATSTGDKSATLSFASNAATSPNTVALTGTGVAPVFETNPPSKDFGTAVVGASANREVIVINSATGPWSGTLKIPDDGVSLAGADAADFRIVLDDCSRVQMSSGHYCTVNVRFTPSAIGERHATLLFQDNLPGSPDTVPLTGTGTTPFTVSPTALTFPAQAAGTSSASQLVTVKNVSTAARKVNNVTLTGTEAADFVRFGSGCIGKTLAVNATCQVSVAFRPATSGGKTAQLTVLSGGLTQQVDLSGIALSGPALSVNPPLQDFGDQLVGTPSATQAFVVTNAFTSPLTIKSVELAGTDAADFLRYAGGCLNVTLDPGETCTVSARFRPQTTGEKTAQLKLPTTAGTVKTVDLFGTGVTDTVLVFDPAAWDFGNQLVGTPSATKTFTVTNGSSASLTINHADLVGADAASFIRYAGGCLNVTLGPGESCTVSARFKPGSEGAKTAQLKLTVPGKATQLIDLSGTGTLAT